MPLSRLHYRHAQAKPGSRLERPRAHGDGRRLQQRADLRRTPQGRGAAAGLLTKLLPVAAAVIGAVSFLILTDGGRETRRVEPLIVQFDRLAERVGFGLEQASVSGHRMTAANDVLDALNLGRARSLVRFDSGGARERIEQLPWVREARVMTVWPHRVDVHVTERAPYAVWRREGHDMLVDAEGRHLAAVASGSARNLALLALAGAGAPEAARGAMDELKSYPDLMREIVMLERVAERRWSLHLTGRRVVLLPEKGVAEALAAFTEGSAGHRLLDADFERFDLRDPARFRVRLRGQKAAHARS